MKTKKPKSVVVTWTPISYVAYRSTYTFPSCKTIFEGAVCSKSVTRFICDCGQELIVKPL